MMFEAPQTVCSLAGEALSPPIVQLSRIRTHSTGLKAYFHNPLQKPPGYTPLSISPLRAPLHPASSLPASHPWLPVSPSLFGLITFLDSIFASLRPSSLRPALPFPPFPFTASPIVYFSSPFPEKERGLACAVKRADVGKPSSVGAAGRKQRSRLFQAENYISRFHSHTQVNDNVHNQGGFFYIYIVVNHKMLCKDITQLS